VLFYGLRYVRARKTACGKHQVGRDTRRSSEIIEGPGKGRWIMKVSAKSISGYVPGVVCPTHKCRFVIVFGGGFALCEKSAFGQVRCCRYRAKLEKLHQTWHVQEYPRRV